MRIVFVTPVYWPYKAGMAHVVLEEARGLVGRGHEVHVVTQRRGEAAHEVRDGVQIHRYGAWIWYDKSGWIPCMNRRVYALAPDVIHLHLPCFGVQELTWWRKRVPLVATYHMDIAQGEFVGFVARISRLFFVPHLWKRLDRLFVSSLDYARGSWLMDVWSDVESRVIEAPFGVD
ncbi:glycosyltransferase, partial [Candidatus Uhrbacteria bacterium]|nr:glycosyltransferase [Candidatus Uhrbacteria bacterium]